MLLLPILLASLDRLQSPLWVHGRPFDVQHHRAQPTVKLVRWRQLESATSSHPTPARRASDRDVLLDVAVYLLNGFTVLDQIGEELFSVVRMCSFRLSSSVLKVMRPSLIERNICGFGDS